jgi:hypothetical protein
VYDMLLGVTNSIVIVISAHEWPRHFCMHEAILCYTMLWWWQRYQIAIGSTWEPNV